MEELLNKVFEEEEWSPLRFTVYNYLEEKECYQQKLEKMGYESSYDDLVGKTIKIDNATAKQFKSYVENKLQHGKIVITVCVIENGDYFTIVKPQNVDENSILSTSQS
jgi:hypothetical protein